MSFLYLLINYTEKPKQKIKKFSSQFFVGRFYRNHANNVDSAINSYFYGRNANDTEDIKKYLLATSHVAKGMQDDINLNVTHNRLNNA